MADSQCSGRKNTIAEMCFCSTSRSGSESDQCSQEMVCTSTSPWHLALRSQLFEPLCSTPMYSTGVPQAAQRGHLSSAVPVPRRTRHCCATLSGSSRCATRPFLARILYPHLLESKFPQRATRGLRQRRRQGP